MAAATCCTSGVVDTLVSEPWLPTTPDVTRHRNCLSNDSETADHGEVNSTHMSRGESAQSTPSALSPRSRCIVRS